MSLPVSGIRRGEVRIDPANGLAYRYIHFTTGGFSGYIWAPNIAEFLEARASSEGLPTTNVAIGDLAVDKNTGVKFRWDGAAWKLVSTIVGVGSSVTTGEIINGAVTSDKLAVGVLRVVQVTIPSAAVLTLLSNPVTLVAAPGVGKFIRVENIVASMKFATVPYGTNVDLEFHYTNAAGDTVSANIGGASGFLNATSDTAESVGGIVESIALTENAPIVVIVPNGNPTDGDSDVKITVAYRVVSL